MERTLNRLKWTFLGLFALLAAAAWTYQIGWTDPRTRCEGAHRWWSDEARVCATPVLLSSFTGRTNRPASTPTAQPRRP